MRSEFQQAVRLEATVLKRPLPSKCSRDDPLGHAQTRCYSFFGQWGQTAEGPCEDTNSIVLFSSSCRVLIPKDCCGCCGCCDDDGNAEETAVAEDVLSFNAELRDFLNRTIVVTHSV